MAELSDKAQRVWDCMGTHFGIPAAWNPSRGMASEWRLWQDWIEHPRTNADRVCQQIRSAWAKDANRTPRLATIKAMYEQGLGGARQAAKPETMCEACANSGWVIVAKTPRGKRHPGHVISRVEIGDYDQLYTIAVPCRCDIGRRHAESCPWCAENVRLWEDAFAKRLHTREIWDVQRLGGPRVVARQLPADDALRAYADRMRAERDADAAVEVAPVYPKTRGEARQRAAKMMAGEVR